MMRFPVIREYFRKVNEPGMKVHEIFIYIAIFAGLFDSFRAYHLYSLSSNPPISSLSFILTVAASYGIAGFLYSLPILILQRIDKSEEKVRLSRWTSWFLLPIFLIPLLPGFRASFFSVANITKSSAKILIGFVIVIIYSVLLYYSSKPIIMHIRKKGIPGWIPVFIEFSIGIFGLMFITGIYHGFLHIRMAAALVISLLSLFVLTSRISPLINSKTRLVTVILAALIIAFPIVRSFIPQRQIKGTGTSNGNGTIILILIDTLRPDYLSAYGSDMTNTPNLDKFTADSLVFDNMHSISSWTIPSVISLMTGLYPSVHQANYDTLCFDNPKIPTIPERLRGAGYATGAFIVNPALGYQSGVNRGFDTFYESFTVISPYRYLLPFTFYMDHILLAGCETGKYHFDGIYVKKMEDRLFPWIENHKNEKAFLYIHYYDPHVPYSPPQKYRTRKNQLGDNSYTYIALPELDNFMLGKSRLSDKTLNCTKDLYSGDIDYCDESLGLLMDKFREVGWDDASIFITADHGEEFLEHHSFEHGQSFYEEITHIPLIVHPGKNMPVIPRTRKSDPINLLDLAATIADLGNVSHLPFYKHIQGKSIFDDDFSDREVRITFMESTKIGDPNRIGVLKNNWKFIVYNYNEIREVYNLTDDPHEANNLINSAPAELLDEIMFDIKNWQSKNNIICEEYDSLLNLRDRKVWANRNLMKGLGYL
jgi:arylsulfatase A-like enzyme